MQQSFIQTWKSNGHAAGLAEGTKLGMLEARRADVLRVLLLRFHGTTPADLTALIQNINDLDQLTQWLDSAIIAPTIEWFRLMIRQQMSALPTASTAAGDEVESASR
ncbi:hypothetical protein [Tuwongella immobilis]|uniref:DUF4351 domain-containing protein n=1 Tax=Tuwongella immobilis TaxID=692036 RepID=A0A6C2YIA7_9BACT|nr:hypothetical protein [Tuwongella immobilis]VIP01146.1 unnamed protein product [Tuwongella immobilis]VTR97718.1 unnamed protein product [Tuwongella immobilis]